MSTANCSVGFAGKNRQFIENVIAWPGPQASGWVNLHTNIPNGNPSDTSAKNNHGKAWVIGWPYRSVDDFVNRAAFIDRPDNSLYNVWFCTSTQSACGTTKAGKPKAVRLAANATAFKGVWIDVDVKAKPADWDRTHPNEEWGHYETMIEAWAAIRAFRKKAGLPRPSAVVGSGGGLHVYWISDKPLTSEEWRPYADGLKAAAVQERLKCDAALTTDPARLLRVPGTLNHKYDPPRLVKLIHFGQMYDFPSEFSPLHGVAPSTSTAKGPLASIVPAIEPGHEKEFDNGPDPAFASLRPSDDLASRIIRHAGQPLEPGPVFEKCGFMRMALAEGGASYVNPLWHLSVLCTVFMENGNALAHEISKGHPTYSHDETQAMYERKVADRARGVGYPSCATIAGAGCQSCATCPYFSKGKSPLHLSGLVTATVNAAATAATPPAWPPADLKVTFSKVRHRRTLYGFDLVRGEITVLGSPGGVGKSSLGIGMGVSIAVGKELLGEKIRGSDLKVLLINAEDSGEEIQRRVWAFCLAHTVGEHELDRLFVAGADDPRVQRLSFLHTNEKGQSQLDANGFAQLRVALQTLSPDVVMLDPLVALCSSGNMNDNPSMSLVMRALKSLAIEFNCAILVVHHTRKNADADNAESISGAASIVNLARRAIMPVTVSEQEAKHWGILPSERLRHFKLVDAKSNLAPRSADPTLYRLHSVVLPNAEPPIYPSGDNVQAVTRIQLPLHNSATVTTNEDKSGKCFWTSSRAAR
jgi:AAA domain